MSKNSRKPRKPRPDFALFAHANGQWAKKIRGRLHDFGSWSDPEAALQEYLRIKDDLQAGRIPTLPASGAVTLADVCNVHLPQSKERHDGGEIGPRTLDDSHDACKPIVAHLGRKVDPEQLRPADFAGFRGAVLWRSGRKYQQTGDVPESPTSDRAGRKASCQPRGEVGGTECGRLSKRRNICRVRRMPSKATA